MYFSVLFLYNMFSEILRKSYSEVDVCDHLKKINEDPCLNELLCYCDNFLSEGWYVAPP